MPKLREKLIGADNPQSQCREWVPTADVAGSWQWHASLSRREAASLPFTLAYCVRSAIGPFVGYLGTKWGVRTVTLIGCVLSPFAVGACFFAESILSFTLLWGIFFGLSFGLETSLLNVILNEHFIKHRVKANGLNISGASLGTLLLSPLIENAVEMYGLSGTFLIIAGLMLNSIPAAAVMLLNKPVLEVEESEDTPFAIKECIDSETCDFPDVIANKKIDSNDDINSKKTKNDLPCDKKEKDNIEFSKSIKTPSIILDVSHLNSTPTNSAIIHKTYRQWMKKAFFLPSALKNRSYVKDINVRCVSFNVKHNDAFMEKIPNGNLPKTFYGTNSDYESHHKPSIISTHSLPGIPVTKPSKWMLYRLFFDPIYIFLLLGSGIYFFAITTFLTIIVDYATDKGISMTYSTYIVMWIAVSDMFGYFCLGWIIERGYISQSRFAAFSYMCMCLMTAAMVWCDHYILLLFLISVFEFGQCGVIILSAPLVAELIDDDLQEIAIASVSILSSPTTMAVSPIIGFFRDGQGSYEGVFYVLSAASLFCALLFLCIPKLERRRDKRKSLT
ncbi:monocarboxylate transporter 9 [Trichonephila inaurata madagascariensis]|uniref:Monocarboxylate transporter 9 n=1 Tax=Trichonephila inaurata madagascariensis TaxID=2747483 RepID=A0A8X6Y1I9_9ARAC|nr:monocarboxylate transporter 9 [Trichonephila inaurata madagascariensis]